MCFICILPLFFFPVFFAGAVGAAISIVIASVCILVGFRSYRKKVMFSNDTRALLAFTFFIGIYYDLLIGNFETLWLARLAVEIVGFGFYTHIWVFQFSRNFSQIYLSNNGMTKKIINRKAGVVHGR